MSFWLPYRARWSLAPGVRRENEGEGKRGPRNRGGAAATERTSAQQVFHRYSVQSSLKTSALRAAEPLVARCPFGCRPELRGPWVPAFAGKTKSRKAGTQEPRWCRCHGADLSAASVPSVQCAGFCQNRRPPRRRVFGAPMSLWLPPSGPWFLAPGVRRENEG